MGLRKASSQKAEKERHCSGMSFFLYKWKKKYNTLIIAYFQVKKKPCYNSLIFLEIRNLLYKEAYPISSISMMKLVKKFLL